MVGDIITLSRWRPPDPGNATAARACQGSDGGADFESTWTGRKYTSSGSGASNPRVFVKPFGGAFSATFLRRDDGTEHRLQIFPDPHAAARCAKLLNAALEGRL